MKIRLTDAIRSRALLGDGAMSGPICPQPARCGNVTMAPGRASAIRSETTAAQTTVGTTST